MSETATEDVRVAQVWPKSLKERVRRLAGARGMTTWTIEAVEQRLAREGSAAPPAPTTPVQAAPTPAPAAIDPLQNQAIADIAGAAGLRRASELGVAAPVEAVPAAVEVPVDTPTELCPKCQQPLVNGECWNCW